MLVYLRNGSAQTSLRAATLKQKFQIKLSTSFNHSILPPGHPVPVLTLSCQVPGRVATGVPISQSLVYESTRKNPQAGIEPRIFRSRGGRLNHKANKAVSKHKFHYEALHYGNRPMAFPVKMAGQAIFSPLSRIDQ